MCSQRFGYISGRPGFQKIFVQDILPEAWCEHRGEPRHQNVGKIMEL